MKVKIGDRFLFWLFFIYCDHRANAFVAMAVKKLRLIFGGSFEKRSTSALKCKALKQISKKEEEEKKRVVSKVVVLLFKVHRKQLLSCRDSQLSYSHSLGQAY